MKHRQPQNQPNSKSSQTAPTLLSTTHILLNKFILREMDPKMIIEIMGTLAGGAVRIVDRPR